MIHPSFEHMLRLVERFWHMLRLVTITFRVFLVALSGKLASLSLPS